MKPRRWCPCRLRYGPMRRTLPLRRYCSSEWTRVPDKPKETGPHRFEPTFLRSKAYRYPACISNMRPGTEFGKSRVHLSLVQGTGVQGDRRVIEKFKNIRSHTPRTP